MILIFNIGNTSTTAALYHDGKIIDSFGTPSKDENGHSLAVNSDVVAVNLRHRLFALEKTAAKIEGAAICSVVPELTDAYVEMSKKLLKVNTWVLDHQADLGLHVKVTEPAKVGADRLANAVALKKIYGYPGFVVDIGTSTNFDVVNNDGDFIGGAIAPGPKTAAAELFRRASQLYEIDIAKPEHAIGRNTTEAMQSGTFYGALGLIEQISARIVDELNHPDIKIIATGGFAELLGPHSKYIQIVDPTLTLKGIALAYKRNN